MFPWYRNFKGTIVLEAENKFITTGKLQRINPTTIEITELPISRWTQVYKEFLESLIESNEIIDYKNNCDECNINFKVIMQKTVIDELIKTDSLIKKLKLTSSLNIGNMHVFDEDLVIRKVSSPEEIIFRFYKVRKEHYIKRKKYLTDKLINELNLLDSKIRFIKAIIAEQIIIFNKPKLFVINQIEKMGNFIKIDNSFDYLLNLKIYTFTSEKIKDLEDKHKVMTAELEILKKTTIETTWNSELTHLEF